jgi:hypothetical protein
VPKFQTKIEKMRNELEAWMKREGDPGVLLDSPEAHQAAKYGKHLF